SESDLTDLEPVLITTWKMLLEKNTASPAMLKVSGATLKTYTGTYSGNGKDIFILFEDGRLQAESPKGRLPKTPLDVLAETQFQLTALNIKIEFVKNEAGTPVKMLVVQDGQTFEFKKIK